MSEPIWTQITLAIPAGYGTYPARDDELRQIAEALEEAVYDGENDGELVAGELWQVSGLASYGLNSEQDAILARAQTIGVEYDASAEAKYDWPGEIRMWRKGWEKMRQWEQSADVPVITQFEVAALKTKHLVDTFPADYIGFVEALDAFWPPPSLIARDDPPTSAVA